MTFEDKKNQKASERFLLARMIPKRFINDLLIDQGSDLYLYAFPEPLDSVDRNGVTLTRVAGIPTSFDEWSYEDGLLYIKLEDPPNADTNVIVMFYLLFYTTGRVRVADEEPGSGNISRVWKPRILSEIFLGQSIKNMLYGTLSTSTTNFAIANADNDFQKFLTIDDSFYNSRMEIWIGIDDVDEVKRVFSGEITAIQVANKEVRIQLKDVFSKLDQKCLMGDSTDESYYLKNANSFINVDPNKAGTPVPYFATPLSRHKTIGSADVIYINDFENYLDWTDVDGTHAIDINEGYYSPSDLAVIMASRMNTQTTTVTISVTYYSEYRKFLFSASGGGTSLTMLWNTGANVGFSIANRIGFTGNSDTSNTVFSIGGLPVNGVYSDHPIQIPVERLDQNSMIESVCTVHSKFSNKSSNRRWGIGRFNSDGPRQLVFDVQVGVDFKTQAPVNISGDTTKNWQNFHMVNFSGANNNIIIGDSFKWTNAAVTLTCFAICVLDQEFTYNGSTYTHAFVVIDQSTKDGFNFLTLNAGDTWHSNDAPAVMVRENASGRYWHLFYEKHFTTTIETLPSGNKFQYLTLVSSAENDMVYYQEDFTRADAYLYRGYPIGEYSNLSNKIISDIVPKSAINPSDHSVLIRAGCKDNILHGDVLKAIALATGIGVETTSFDDANTELAVRTAFTMPNAGDTDFKTYREYAEDILKSTLGILVVDNNFDLQYFLLNAPAGVFATSNKLYLRDTLDVEINYEDIITEIVASNSEYNSDRILSLANSPSVSRKNNKARHLQQIEKTINLEHVLEEMETRIDDIMALRNNRIAVYKWSEATDKIDAILGGDLILESNEILGNLGSIDLKILTIDKSTGKINVEASDLGDL